MQWQHNAINTKIKLNSSNTQDLAEVNEETFYLLKKKKINRSIVLINGSVEFNFTITCCQLTLTCTETGIFLRGIQYFITDIYIKTLCIGIQRLYLHKSVWKMVIKGTGDLDKSCARQTAALP